MRILEIIGFYLCKFGMPVQGIKIYKRVFKNIKILEP